MRALVETGALSGAAGSYRLTRAPHAVEVPATVQAILAARIDRLAAQDKQLLQTAAVIGKDVPYALLAAIADAPEDELRQRLATLQAAEFVYEASLFPDLEYTFKHALTHEVAYGSLLHERRRALHGKILDALGRLYAGRLSEWVEQLGQHALRAERWDEAVDYLRQAGTKAFARGANREAAHTFEQALAAVGHLPQTRGIVEQTVDLRLALRPCLTPLADMNRLLDNTQRAAPLAATLGDRRREALILLYQAVALNNLGHAQEGLAAARRGLALAESLSDPLLQMSGQYFAGQSRNVAGAYREAIGHFEHDVGVSVDALIAQATKPSGPGVLDARSALFTYSFNTADCSAAYSELGAFEAAMQRAQATVQVARAVKLVFLDAMAEIQPARVHLRRGDAGVALPLLEHSVELSRAADFPLAFINAAPELGRAYILAQRPQDAIALLEQAWSVAESGGSLHWGVLCYMHLADAYSMAGQQPRARSTIDHALSIAQQTGFRGREAWALFLQGNILGREPGLEPQVPRSAHRAALALAEQLGMRPLAAHCHREIGASLRREDPQAAHLHTTTAVAMYRDMAMEPWAEAAQA